VSIGDRAAYYNPIEIINYFSKMNLNSEFSEVGIINIYTIPTTTASVEKSF